MATKTKSEKSSSGNGRARASGGNSRNGSNGTNGNLRPEDRKFLDRYGEKLSKSTQRAKWVAAPDDKPDRPGQTLATRSPEVIRKWAEERGGEPATNANRRGGGEARVLRFVFGDDSGRLEPIPWEEWLRTFEERELV